ncbi:MAG: PQQ-binding-like beta-propeller repeat protein [Planctomycetota bacterium]|nr:PQQ-binding-like beta-propeller repeat protein [Planctomycetota bacterium]
MGASFCGLSIRSLGVLLPLLVATLSNYLEADWPQFRGPNASGIGTGSPPIDFGPGRNQLWRVPVGAGHSSPCVVGDAIYLTTVDQERGRLAVVSIDRTRGAIRWATEFKPEQLEKGHPSFNPASSTVACDGQRVIGYFGSYGLVCLSMEGEVVWQNRMPVTKSFSGNATSPVIVGNHVILYRGNYVDHFLLAVDKRTGSEVWKVMQEEEITGEMACAAVPIFADGKLIVHSARSIQAIDPESGTQIWEMKAATTATSTPVVADGEVVVAAWNKLGEPALRPDFPTFQELLAAHDRNGNQSIEKGELPKLWIFHRPDGAEAPLNGATIRFDRVDRNRDQQIDSREWGNQMASIEKWRAGYQTHGILAIPLDSRGVVEPSRVRRLETQGIPEVPSPLFDGVFLYFVKNGGVLTCVDLRSGERVYRTRTGGSGTHYASPVLADGKLFSTAGDGRISVMATGPEPKVLSVNEMGGKVFATPAIVDGVIYVRTHSDLFAFGQEKK